MKNTKNYYLKTIKKINLYSKEIEILNEKIKRSDTELQLKELEINEYKINIGKKENEIKILKDEKNKKIKDNNKIIEEINKIGSNKEEIKNVNINEINPKKTNAKISDVEEFNEQMSKEVVYRMLVQKWVIDAINYCYKKMIRLSKKQYTSINEVYKDDKMSDVFARYVAYNMLEMQLKKKMLQGKRNIKVAIYKRLIEEIENMDTQFKSMN